MNKGIIFSGAPSTGKTTQFDKVREKFGSDPRLHFVEDQGRKMFSELGFDANSMTRKQIEEGQMYVIEGYLREESEASREGKIMVADSSLIEGVAYAIGTFNERMMQIMNNILASRAPNYTSLYFPVMPHILEDDGLRHTCPEFQNAMDEKIHGLLQKHRVKIITIASHDPVVREAIVEADMRSLIGKHPYPLSA